MWRMRFPQPKRIGRRIELGGSRVRSTPGTLPRVEEPHQHRAGGVPGGRAKILASPQCISVTLYFS